MTTLVDTSALFALLDEDDRNHAKAAAWFKGSGSDPDEILLSHGYVMVEAAALVHQRLGVKAVRTLLQALVPAINLIFIEENLHSTAVAAYLAGLPGRISLVDRVSFEIMKDRGIDQAFAFDRDFSRQGFKVVP